MTRDELIYELVELACIMMQLKFVDVRHEVCMEYKGLLHEVYDHLDVSPEDLVLVLRKMAAN